MLKIKLPEASVRNRIRQDGFDEKLFEIFVAETTSTHAQPEHQSTPTITTSNQLLPGNKYKKLRSNGKIC